MVEALLDREERGAWEQFDARYRPILSGVLRRTGLGADDADDLSQEVLLQFVRALREGRYERRRAGLRAWLLTAARSRAIDYLRRRRPDPVRDTALAQLPGEDQLAELWEAEARRRILAEALELLRRSGMDPSTVLAFERYALEEREAGEVARALGMRVGAVYVAKHRCLTRLRQHVHELTLAYGEDGASVDELLPRS